MQFEVQKDTAVDVDVTAGRDSEVEVFRKKLQGGRLYVMDRGYRKYSLLAEILESGSSFVVRCHHNIAYETIEERELTGADQKAGVVSDRIVFAGSKSKRFVTQPLRLIEIFVAERQPRGLVYPVKRVSSKKAFRVVRGQAYTLYILYVVSETRIKERYEKSLSFAMP